MKKLFALVLALLLLCSCGVQEEPVIEEPQSEEKIEGQTEPSVQKRYYRIYSEEELSAMTEEEYKSAARTMGYTDEQLDYMVRTIKEAVEK